MKMRNSEFGCGMMLAKSKGRVKIIPLFSWSEKGGETASAVGGTTFVINEKLSEQIAF